MYYSYIEIEYVAMSFSPARTDLALKLLKVVYKVRIAAHAIRSWIVLWQFQDFHNLVLGQFQEHILLSVLVPR
jgi:hypothetical protein